MPSIRLALAQTNPVLGDLRGNAEAMISVAKEAASQGADLVLFGEMALSGYPIEDLAYRPAFLSSCEAEVARFASRLVEEGLGHLTVVLGHPANASVGTQNGWAIARNVATVLRDGNVVTDYTKHHLPNYSVFDEYRVFVPGNDLSSFDLGGLRFSLVICEDIWQSGGPVAEIAKRGTDVTLVLNGSPFQMEKDDRRLELVQSLAKKQQCAVAYVNLVGGQDDLVFEGDSMYVNASGQVIQRLPKFTSMLSFIDITNKAVASSPTQPSQPPTDARAEVWQALVSGLQDYVNKNGFKSVILGLSGGIDSAVCAAIAKDALGSDRVFGVSMPSDYSSEHSKTDAFDLATRLGISYRTEPIAAITKVAESQLKLTDVAAENLQARVRGIILMGLSNQEGHLTLTTGNKTELAVGYSTIYGDSVGGFGPLKDVEKTLVWGLARWRNEYARSLGELEPIPVNSIEKPPSAELRPGQVDQDSLPPYELLDALLRGYVEEHKNRDELISEGFTAEVVDRIIRLVDASEWKRRQGAIGPKITALSFGRDRRIPITNRFRQS